MKVKFKGKDGGAVVTHINVENLSELAQKHSELEILDSTGEKFRKHFYISK